MAVPTDITTGVQTITATGAVTPTAGLDTSTVTGDFTIRCVVSSLTSAKTAKIYIEESTNAWTASNVLAVIDVVGPIASTAEVSVPYAGLRKYQLPNNLQGATGSVLRANVAAIDANTTLKMHAWIEQ